MKIAIVHHHLNRGGVTQVIANQVRAIDSTIDETGIDVYLFFGGRKSAWPSDIDRQLQRVRLHEVVVPQLDYDEVWEADQRCHGDPDRLLQELEKKFIECGISPNNALLHVHNLNLGRNWCLIQAIGKLQASGYRMLLQAHDFAQDFRPQNYQKLRQKSVGCSVSLLNLLFPSAEQVMFGVINRRDGRYLERIGIDSARIKYIPNPVAPVGGITTIGSAKSKLAECFRRDQSRRQLFDPRLPFLVYPVRGIRRKNIGEAVLLTLVAKSPIQIGITLAPLNPVESASYEEWKSLAGRLRLPVLFECGDVEGVTFSDNMSAADQILTTSVAEGFGMAFLEGMAIGKPLIGRNLPEITADFSQLGISFPQLYEALRIPVNAVSLVDYRDSLVHSLASFYRDYERDFNPELVDKIVVQIQEQGWIDFAKLPLELQFQFVRRAFADPEVRDRLQRLNPECSAQLGSPLRSDDDANLDDNRRLVADHFSLKCIGEQLLEIYNELSEAQPAALPSLQGEDTLIDEFLDPHNIFPIRFATSETDENAKQEKNTDVQLHEIIRKCSVRIDPIPTELEPRLRQLDDIQVVLFDVYGTLLVSSSGDIGADEQLDAPVDASVHDRLGELFSELGWSFCEAQTEFKQAILHKHRMLRELGVPHPEVDTVAIWDHLIQGCLQRGSNGSSETQPEDLTLGWPRTRVEELAVRFELATNPVFPMPQMEATLAAIRDNGVKLGIISNAQFYTPQIIESLCRCRIDELGFDERLEFFSYCFGRAKPDVFLYEMAAETLQELDIAPERVLYVGNHMIKDIVPAKTVGFKTGLFAGDQRSLRLGRYSPPLPTQLVDLVLTNLSQIVEYVSN